jgi:hypothetical protein
MPPGVRAIAFDWYEFQPRLLAYDSGRGEVFDFDYWPLDIVVSHQVRCVGSWANGTYRPCPDDAKVSKGSICQSCAKPLIPVLDCVFEPRCDGELCNSEFCKREHTVYLAFHGALAKIGLTSSKRLRQRMIEQGCDAYAVIARVDGRRSARNMESAISDRLQLRQRVRAIESLALMTATPPEEEIRREHARIGEIVDRLGHRMSELKWLEKYPLTLPIEERPRLVEPAGLHRGRVLGVKGRFLVFENGGLKALNMQELPGRAITHAQAIV